MSSDNKVVGIRILNFERIGPNVLVHYTKAFENGTKEPYRTHVADLGRYTSFFQPKPIVAAECVGKVSLGSFGTDVRVLFIVKLEDGSVELIQVREWKKSCLKLLQLSDDTANGAISAPVPPSGTQERPAEPYDLRKNELPQGVYTVGKDFPAGIYDFFAVYGSGGDFQISKLGSDGKIIDGTWSSYWIGLKEAYEHRELIHVTCP